MSAFFVSDATIDAVVSLMLRHGQISPQLATSTGAALLRLNRAAMLARYPSVAGTAEDREMLAVAAAYRFQARNEGDATLAKSLACFTYQCSEGEVPHRPLFIACAELETRVTPPEVSAVTWRDPSLVRARREYDAAPWGLGA